MLVSVVLALVLVVLAWLWCFFFVFVLVCWLLVLWLSGFGVLAVHRLALVAFGVRLLVLVDVLGWCGGGLCGGCLRLSQCWLRCLPALLCRVPCVLSTPGTWGWYPLRNWRWRTHTLALRCTPPLTLKPLAWP